MLTKTSLSTREAQRPMPEDADQDILEALVCLWPTVRSNRAKLTCQGRGADLGLRWARFNFYFGRAFAGIFLCNLRAFLGQLPAKPTLTLKLLPPPPPYYALISTPDTIS